MYTFIQLLQSIHKLVLFQQDLQILILINVSCQLHESSQSDTFHYLQFWFWIS